MQKQKTQDPMERRLAALKSAKPISAPPEAPFKGRRKSRNSDRQAAYRIVRVLVEDGSAVRAVMRDLSAGGAKIVLEGAIALPPRVTLKVDQTGETRKATVVWQNEAEAGLEFDPMEH
jgi:c-di-GMP-binding flagellar brake protein YcgR